MKRPNNRKKLPKENTKKPNKRSKNGQESQKAQNTKHSSIYKTANSI